jgi:hypothetical protein
MLAKLLDLGIEFRIKPIGTADRRAQIVDHGGAGHPTKMAERIFQAADEALGRLPPHRLAVALARMAQHHPE